MQTRPALLVRRPGEGADTVGAAGQSPEGAAGQSPEGASGAEDSPCEASWVETPRWLLWLCGLALLLMANQIKLPVAGGRLGIADLGFVAAFGGLVIHLWRSRQRVFFPLLALVALGVIALANLLSRPGLDGAVEVAQLVQQFFCGLLIMSFLVERAPRLALGAATAGLAVNLGLAFWQAGQYGFGFVLPPADVLKISWGFGEAYTGLFRSRMALSFFLAAVLAWAQPQWFGKKPGLFRCLGVLVGTVAVLAGIAHGQMLFLAVAALLLGAALQSRRALAVNVAAVAVLAVLVTSVMPEKHRQVVHETFMPLKTDRYPGELKTNHLDFVAALRLAGRVPWTGVGAGRYQQCVGRCYEDLPNPVVNDIDTDTQAAWGILAGTAGIPAALVFLALLLTAAGSGLRRYYLSKQGNTMALGGALALLVFVAGMAVSDPLTRGLGWFVALGLASASLPNRWEDLRQATLFGLRPLIAGAVALGLALAAVAAIKPAADPLAAGHDAGAVSTRRPRGDAAAAAATAGPAAATAGVPGVAIASDFFKVIDAAEVKTMTPPFEKVSDSQASRETALRIQDGKGVPPDGQEPAMEHGGAVFEFEVPSDLECKVWLRVWWDGSCGNTINLKMDDEPRSVTVGNDGTYNTWHWMPSPKTYKLAAGKHTVTLLNREDGIMFDQMLITNDQAYYPQGIEEE